MGWYGGKKNMITLILIILGLVFVLAGASCLLIVGIIILFNLIHYENDKVDKILELIFKIAMMLVAFSAGISLIFYILGEFPS